MTSVLKIVGTMLLFLVVAAALAVTIVPRFLDRIYYRGATTTISTARALPIPMAMPIPAHPAAGAPGSSGAR